MVTTAARQQQRRRTSTQWTSENPVLAAGEFGVESDTLNVKVGDGATGWTGLPYVNNVAELVAGDPTEVDLDTVGDTTTLTLLDTVARFAYPHRSGNYYYNHYGTSAASSLTQSNLLYMPRWLEAGTIDRIGVDVAAGAASNTYRLGIYTDNDGYPGSLIAEATSGVDTYPIDASGTGIKTAAIDADIPTNGMYWFALVQQGGATATIQCGPNAAAGYNHMPLGTTAPGGTSVTYSRAETGITGALPSTYGGGTTGTSGQGRFRVHYRYA